MLVTYGILVMLVICDVVGRALAQILGGIEVMKFDNVGNLLFLLDELWLEFWGVLGHMWVTC